MLGRYLLGGRNISAAKDISIFEIFGIVGGRMMCELRSSFEAWNLRLIWGVAFVYRCFCK